MTYLSYYRWKVVSKIPHFVCIFRLPAQSQTQNTTAAWCVDFAWQKFIQVTILSILQKANIDILEPPLTSLKVWTPTTTWLASPCKGGWSYAEPSTALSSSSPQTVAPSPTPAQSQLGLPATTVTSTSTTTTTTITARSTAWGSPESCRQSIQSLNLTRSHWPSWKCQTLQLCRYQSHRNYKINFHSSKPYKLDIDKEN